jgi:DNA-binding NarL/FixJ family response regulator
MRWAEGMLDAFERMGWGALLIDGEGRLISLNREARRHVGNEISIAHGQVAAKDRTANAELKDRIAAILSAKRLSAPGSVMLPRPAGRPLMAHIITVPEREGASPQEARAIIVLIDFDKQSDPPAEILQRCFHLTPAETRVALAFTRGDDLYEIASQQALSIETVRKSFKAILAKTNTSRQAELAMLLARLAQRPRDQELSPNGGDGGGQAAAA